jgi:sulfur carrier protein ThiS adenylyltransferase
MSVLLKGLGRYLDRDTLRRLASRCVGIAGAGGLGSNTAMILARSGFRRFVIADFDSIESSNLNRQFYFEHQVGRSKAEALQSNLLAIDSALDVVVHDLRLSIGNAAAVFSGCDVLVEALDKAESKRMLTEAWLSTGRLLVAVSGIPAPGRGMDIRIRKVRKNFWLVGDGTTDTTSNVPPMAPGVLAAAALQADVVLGEILKEREDGGCSRRIEPELP